MKTQLAVLLLCLGSALATAADRPNILWLTCEDNSVDWVGCYGNPHADTPNIDRLATEGFQYMHAYANAPVCAPQRCTWITGVHAISMGTHPMRSRYEIPHDRIAYYPDILKEAGYFVSNAGKTDYNVGGRDDKSPWDSGKVEWDKLEQRQPFFQIINSTKSHESKAFGDVTKTNHSPDDVRLAKYHPDIPVIRQNYAHYHDQIKKMDADIGAALEALEKSGLAENTIVIHNSDHGGVIARSKRYLFNSGTHCPLIIRIPEKYKHLRPGTGEPGTKINDLVSFVDMPATWISLAGAEIPATMQGRVFLGEKAQPREYHVSFRGRMDERCDNVRAVRDRKFLYIRNYMPYAPWGQHLNYLWTMKATQAWEEHDQAGLTDAVTGRYFGTKPMEELYDVSADPDNVNNLADSPEYAKEVVRLSAALDAWQAKHFDSGLLPETEVVKMAADAGVTIYDLVRDPRLYDVQALQNASALALREDPADVRSFYEGLGSDNAGLRYWAVVGLFNVQEKTELDPARILSLLEDQSHHVRVMAAWILYRAGEKSAAQACWNELLESSSYASLKVCNVIDWIGDGIDPYKASLEACQFDHGGYVDRMKEYLEVPIRKAGKEKKARGESK